jgi:hypothetical protein
MHHLITITPTFDYAERLDTGPGGPGPLFGWMAERYQPVAFWVNAAERSASWIVDVDDEQLVEITHIAARRAGTTPQVTPIVLGDRAAKLIPAAVEVASQAP